MIRRYPRVKVTPEDVNFAKAIRGCLVSKMKGDTVRKNAKQMTQSTVKVTAELIKLQQDVKLTIDIFFINKHTFFSTYSTKICFTTVTHLTLQTKALIWESLLAAYKMYLLHGFRIIVIKGNQEFTLVGDLIVNLPTTPKLDWAAALQH